MFFFFLFLRVRKQISFFNEKVKMNIFLNLNYFLKL